MARLFMCLDSLVGFLENLSETKASLLFTILYIFERLASFTLFVNSSIQMLYHFCIILWCTVRLFSALSTTYLCCLDGIDPALLMYIQAVAELGTCLLYLSLILIVYVSFVVRIQESYWLSRHVRYILPQLRSELMVQLMYFIDHSRPKHSYVECRFYLFWRL